MKGQKRHRQTGLSLSRLCSFILTDSTKKSNFDLNLVVFAQLLIIIITFEYSIYFSVVSDNICVHFPIEHFKFN